MVDFANYKKDFPIFNQKHNGKDLVYLDSAATSQKPNQVINAISDFYSTSNSNVSRSSHFLAERANELFDQSRSQIAAFISASADEIIFTKNATDSLNLVALGYCNNNLSNNDVIVTSNAEHNSSLLPFLAIADKTGASISYIRVDIEGDFQADWERLFTNNVKVVVLTHVSNVLGKIYDLEAIIKKAHSVGAIVIVDGSQAVSKIPVNVKELDVDFYAFSSHKMLGPMGLGVLYGKKKLLEQMIPVFYGGGMVSKASVHNTNLLGIPQRLEPGTPNVAGVVGLAAATDYLNMIGTQNIRKHDCELLEYSMDKLNLIESLHVLGPTNFSERSGLISFYIDGIHSHDISAFLNADAIAVRSGLHCSMKLFEDLSIPSTTRISFHLYNSFNDIDKFIESLEKSLKLLK